jgi:hypothetical protein
LAFVVFAWLLYFWSHRRRASQAFDRAHAEGPAEQCEALCAAARTCASARWRAGGDDVDSGVDLLYHNMAMIEEIRAKIAQDQFEFSQHAVDQSIIRYISVQEIREMIADGQVIEDYPDDKYGPSCLIFGFTLKGRPLHVQCSYPSRPLVKIITLYEPDPKLWIDFRVRRT